MHAEPGYRPPRLARWVALRRLPAEVAEALTGDLEEECALRVAPARGKVAADLWYWGQVLTLRAGTLRRISRRLRAARPTWERNRPRRVGTDQPDFWSRIPMRPEDIRYAVRRLLRTPGFTFIAVLSLGLGIGANTAMFSVVNAVLLRGLPVAEPERLVEVYTSDSNGYEFAFTSYPDFLDMRARSDVFEGVVGTRTFLARMERGGEPAMAFGEVVSWDYFQVLGVPMELGRPFLPEEDATPGTHPVAIVGHRTWVKDFGGDPGIVGRTVRLNGQPFTVVGVAPRSFPGSMPVLVSGFYAPLMMSDALVGPGLPGTLERRGSRSMVVKARLRPGVTAEQAGASLSALASGLAEAHPETNEHRTMSVLPSGDVAVHPFLDQRLMPVAALLLGVVGLVLLIACANLASFLLARAEDRRKEIAMRLALGAGRGALVRQLLTETTILAMLGGAAGILMAHWTLGILMAFRPPLPFPVELDVNLDQRVLVFTAAVSLLAGILFGLVPALQATNPDVAPTLKDEGRGTGKPGRFNLRHSLVVVQVAFSFVLLIGAGLFVRSLQKAQLIDPGFYTGPAALVWPNTVLSGYVSQEEQEAFAREARAKLLAHPSIEEVAVTNRVPLGAATQTRPYQLPDVRSDQPDGRTDVDYTDVDLHYFDVMEVPIVRGRGFTEADAVGDVVVVSQAFVTRFYPGRDVVGMSLNPDSQRPLQVLGVAADTKVRTLGEDPRPFVYHYSDRVGADLGGEYIVRGRGTSAELLAAAKGVFEEMDPDLVFMEAKTMNEHLALMLFPPRMAALLLGVFGGLALLLSAVGIYGVVSYAVARRTRELGIRMSLGASARDVVVMAVGGGMRLVLLGGAVGVVLAGAVTWSVAGFLYGIEPTDMVTFAVIPVILTGVALTAALVPARRASAVNPVIALRRE